MVMVQTMNLSAEVWEKLVIEEAQGAMKLLSGKNLMIQREIV